MRPRLWLVLSLFVALVVFPSVALADEVGSEIREETFEVTELRATPDTPMSMIRYWFNNVRFVQDGNTRKLENMLPFLQRYISHGNYKNSHLLPAVGLVFVWWGSRKVTRIIMRSIRKGKINA